MTVSYQGWLSKHSRSSLANIWHRRWFMLIGGTLYYSKSESLDKRAQVFAELIDALRVEFIDDSFASAAMLENGLIH